MMAPNCSSLHSCSLLAGSSYLDGQKDSLSSNKYIESQCGGQEGGRSTQEDGVETLIGLHFHHVQLLAHWSKSSALCEDLAAPFLRVIFQSLEHCLLPGPSLHMYLHRTPFGFYVSGLEYAISQKLGEWMNKYTKFIDRWINLCLKVTPLVGGRIGTRFQQQTLSRFTLSCQLG